MTGILICVLADPLEGSFQVGIGRAFVRFLMLYSGSKLVGSTGGWVVLMGGSFLNILSIFASAYVGTQGLIANGSRVSSGDK